MTQKTDFEWAPKGAVAPGMIISPPPSIVGQETHPGASPSGTMKLMTPTTYIGENSGNVIVGNTSGGITQANDAQIKPVFDELSKAAWDVSSEEDRPLVDGMLNEISKELQAPASNRDRISRLLFSLKGYLPGAQQVVELAEKIQNLL